MKKAAARVAGIPTSLATSTENTTVECHNDRGVIFDLDGVLIDNAWAHRQAWYDLAAKEGVRMTDEFFRDTFGMQNDKILPLLIGSNISAQRLEELARWKEQRYREIVRGNLAPVPGAIDLVKNLKANRFRLAIGSSAPLANVRLFAEALHLDEYFDELVTKEDVTESKPSPQTFLKAAERLRLLPKRCVVVEDAVAGVEAGKAAGMTVVAVTATRRRNELDRADVIVDSLRELRASDFASLLGDLD